MDLKEIIHGLEFPNNPFDRDLAAVRHACLHLLKKKAAPKEEPKPKKKGK